MKKRFTIVFTIVVIILIVIYCIQIINVNSEYNHAVDGKIDLNNEYIESFGYVPLSGYWDFYADEYIMPNQLIGSQKNKISVYLPGEWKGEDNVYGKKGYGTYVLRLDNIYDEKEVRFFFPIGPSEAYDVYIDNEKVFSAGQISINEDEVIRHYKSDFTDVIINDETIITMHVSNQSLHKGGFVRPIIVGQKVDMHRLEQKILIKDIFVFASLTLFLVMICIAIFIINKKKLLLTYFLIADLMFICYVLSTGETFVNNFFVNVPFLVCYSLYFLPSMYGGTLLILVVHNIYSEYKHKFVAILSLIKVAVLSFIFFFMPSIFLGTISSIKDMLVLMEFGYCITILVHAIISKRKNTVIILAGVITLLCTIIWDMLYAYGVISTPLELFAPYGFVIFMLCFVISISKEYQLEYRKVFEHNSLLLELKEKEQNQEEERKYNISLMGDFEVYRNDGSQVYFKTKKTKELLAYMVHHKNKELTSDNIIHDLWSDKPFDKAKGIFYTTFYFLRKEFNTEENVIFDKRYILTEEYFLSDYDVFSNLLCSIEENKGIIDDANIKIFEKLMASYNDGYFGNEPYAWAHHKRIEIENKVTRYAHNALEFYIDKNQIDEEIALCEKMILIDEFQERFYKRLLVNYKKQNNLKRYEAINHKYEQVKKEIG